MHHDHTSAHLRAATPEDAEQLFDMARLLATSATPRREAFDQVFADILADSHQCLIVAQSTDWLVGYLYELTHPAFHANGQIAWVEELYVGPDQRGRGLGRRLMHWFETWAQQTASAQYIAVATRRAHDFYSAIGYTESATYYKKNVH